MTEEQFDLIITALRYILFALGFISGISIGRWIDDLINRSK